MSNLNSEYLEVIPKVNPTLITAILHKHQVDAELKMLKSAFTLSYSVRAMLGAYKNQDRVNPYDYMIGTIGAQLSIVDQNSEETNLILHYLNSDKLYGYNLRNIVKVEDVEHRAEAQQHENSARDAFGDQIRRQFPMPLDLVLGVVGSLNHLLGNTSANLNGAIHRAALFLRSADGCA